MNVLSYLLVLFIRLIIGINCKNSETIEYCIDSKYHKKEPAKENVLYKQCEPWKQYSCCSEETTRSAHKTTNHYKFNYNHCPQTPMSEECKRHFVQDLCFYECEPYIKPWVVSVNRSFASERIFKVPICSSDCDLWWSHCKNEYTCAYNWARDFKWINGTNHCPQNSKCNQMKNIFSGAQEFCEKVWDHSWKYTEQNKPCMRIWFNGTLGNPNKATAEYYASAFNSAHLLQFDLFYSIIPLIFLALN